MGLVQAAVRAGLRQGRPLPRPEANACSSGVYPPVRLQSWPAEENQNLLLGNEAIPLIESRQIISIVLKSNG